MGVTWLSEFAAFLLGWIFGEDAVWKYTIFNDVVMGLRIIFLESIEFNHLSSVSDQPEPGDTHLPGAGVQEEGADAAEREAVRAAMRGQAVSWASSNSGGW